MAKSVTRIETKHRLMPLCALLWLVGYWVIQPTSAASLAQEGDTAEESGLAPEANEKLPEAVELAGNYDRPTLIEFEGEIGRRMQKYFDRRLAKAERDGADLVVVEINSPGGGLEESLAIAEALRDVDWADTIAFIPERALSGAALISLGCDQIVISPTGRIGDAGVIFLDPSFMFRYAPEKIMSDLVRRARDLAENQGHPADLAEAMIDRTALVYRRVLPGGVNEFRIFHVDEATENPPDRHPAIAGNWEGGPEAWELVEESVPNRFLTVNGSRAKELGLASFHAETRSELLEAVGTEGPFTVHKYGSLDTAVYILNLPLVTVLLFVVGLVALYFELSAPGISIGGLISGLCFALFFWSRFLGGTAEVLELLLFIAGVIFILVEIFVIPGFGLSGILGLLLLVSSLVMASQSFVIPRTSAEIGSTAVWLGVVVGSFGVFFVIALAIGKYMGSIPVLRGFVLSPPTEEGSTDASASKLLQGKPAQAVHPKVSVGDWGKAESVLRPSGKAKFGPHTVDVVSAGEFVQPGADIKVAEIHGNRIVVIPVDE